MDITTELKELDEVIAQILVALKAEGLAKPAEKQLLATLKEHTEKKSKLLEEVDDEERCKPFALDELSQEPPDLDFLFGEFIPSGKCTVFAAGGGSGKTSLETGLAVHRALGLDFLGLATKPGKTLIITAEDDRADFVRKVKAWTTFLTNEGVVVDLHKIQELVRVYDRSGKDCSLTQADGKRYETSRFAYELVEKIRKRDADASLIVLETASRFGSGDESNGDMSALNRAIELLAKETGAAILLSAHVSKQAGRERMKDAYVARGGSALSDNSRSVMVLSKLDRKTAKARFGDVPEEKVANRIIQLSLAKSNFSSGMMDPLLLERVTTKYRGGLVLKLLDPQTTFLAKDSAETQKQKGIASVEQLVARLVELEAGPVTVSRMNGTYRQVTKEMTGLGKEALAAAIGAAAEAGILTAAEITVRGNRCVGYTTSRAAQEVRDEAAAQAKVIELRPRPLSDPSGGGIT